MGVLAQIFGAGDIVAKGMALVDALHTSTEEEIAAKSKAKTDLLSAYAPFKVAQRLIALMFTVTYLACFCLVLFITIKGGGDLDAIPGVLSEFWIGPIMLTIVGFYFSGGAIEGVMKTRGVKK